MPNWKKVIVSGSEASLLNLIVDNNVTASFFTGSFKGDGSELTNLNLDDGLPDNNFDYNIPDFTPINDFQTASVEYLIDFRNEQLVGNPAGLIAWFGNAEGDTQLLPTNNGLIIIADDEQQGLITSAGYSGSIVGIGNVELFSQSVDERLNELEAYNLPNHPSAPASPQSGSLYFNTADFHFYGWNGSIWKQLDN